MTIPCKNWEMTHNKSTLTLPFYYADDSSTKITANNNREDSYLTSANLCRWVINYKQLQIEKKIGTGTYGMVYRAKWKGVDVAVKVTFTFFGFTRNN